MSPHLASKPTSVRRFHREAKAASRIEHPNCVAVSDFGAAEDLLYMVMEFVDGPSLAQIIRVDGVHVALPVERALPIFMQICAGLSAAHRLGVVHRDVKSSNVVLIKKDGKDDFVKVLDFGIAQIAAEDGEATLTESGEVFGSPPYMSPEQCRGEKLDARSDIYSLGCLMYEVLNGRLPLEGENFIATITKQTSETPEKIIFSDSVNKLIGARLNELIVDLMLAKEPDQRPQSMADLQTELTVIESALKDPSRLKNLSRPQRTRILFSNWSNALQSVSFVGAPIIVVFAIVAWAVFLPASEPAFITRELELKPIEFTSFEGSSQREGSTLGQSEDIWTEIGKADRYLASGDLYAANLRYTNAYSRPGRDDLRHSLPGAIISGRSAFCLLFTGQPARAKDCAELAMQTLRGLGQDGQMAAVLPAAVLAKACMLTKDLEGARVALNEVQSAVRGHELKDRNLALSFAISFYAQYLRLLGNLKAAEIYYKNAVNTWQAFGDKGAYNRYAMLDQLATVEQRLAKFGDAEKNLKEAIDAVEASKDRNIQLESRLRFHLAQVLWDQNGFDRYIAALKERAIALAEGRGYLK